MQAPGHRHQERWLGGGSGAIMGMIIGNHDVSRFASESAGNADGDSWAGPAQPLDPTVYAKQRLARDLSPSRQQGKLNLGMLSSVNSTGAGSVKA